MSAVARPDRYLDTALHLAAAADPGVRAVERADVTTLQATLLSLSLEPAGGGTRLVATVEARVTAPDRAVATRVLSAEKPVTTDLPGDAAEALARLMHDLARECLAQARPRD